MERSDLKKPRVDFEDEYVFNNENKEKKSSFNVFQANEKIEPSPLKKLNNNKEMFIVRSQVFENRAFSKKIIFFLLN